MSKLKVFKILGLVSAISIALIGVWVWQARKTSEVNQQITAVVANRDLKIEFLLDGSLQIEKYEPGFSVGGKIAQVLVKEGDTVKRGQWLVTLDSTEAQKNLEKVLRDFSKERNDFDETTLVEYADNELTDSLKRILENNQWDLEKAVLDVELKDLALRQSRLLSPIDGVVGLVEVKPGDVVSTQSSSAGIVVVNPDVLSFVSFAEESEVLKIDQTQKVSVILDAYEKNILPAALTFVSPIASIDSNGLTSYKVAAEIENPESLRLIDGMEGSLRFVTKEVSGVLSIPNKAVYTEQSKSYVDKVEAGESIKIEIQTGFTDGKYVEVINGVQAGEEVVVRN